MKTRSIFGGRSSLFGSEGSDEVIVDLNLTPLMDVMSNILFFLLASFGAAILSFMAASVPVEEDSPSATTEVPRTDKVVVNIRLEPEGYRVNLSGDKIDATQLAGHTRSIPRAGVALDVETLAAHLFEVKKAYPASDTAIIVPSDTAVYEEIVRTMEVIRFKTVEDNKRLRLFPKIVVAELVKDAK